MKFDVEKIHCSHCNKEIGRNDKFIFTHYLFNNVPNQVDSESKCFCSTECAKFNEPLLEMFINDMIVKNRNRYMYNTNSILFTDEIEFENKRSKIIELVKAFNSFVNKYNSHTLYIELNTTLNKLKERHENQMKD